MTSAIIAENLQRAYNLLQELLAANIPPQIHRILSLRGNISSRHRNWLINETPKFYLQLSGCTVLQYPGGRQRLNEGEVILLAPHIPHRETHHAGVSPYAALVINFRNGKMQVIISGYQEESKRSGIPDRDYVAPAFRLPCLELVRLLLMQELALDFFVQHQSLLTFLALAQRGYFVTPAEQPALPALLLRILQLLQERIGDSSLTVNSLAREAGCTPEHLSRLFRAHHNTSLKEHLIACRLQLAAEILRSRPDASILSVAYMAGFSSGAYFCTSFRRKYGVPPAEFRRTAVAPV